MFIFIIAKNKLYLKSETNPFLLGSKHSYTSVSENKAKELYSRQACSFSVAALAHLHNIISIDSLDNVNSDALEDCSCSSCSIHDLIP